MNAWDPIWEYKLFIIGTQNMVHIEHLSKCILSPDDFQDWMIFTLHKNIENSEKLRNLNITKVLIITCDPYFLWKYA